MSGTHQIFISYSSKEKETAKRVCSFLEKNKFTCWIAPRNINPGENYPTQIVNAIRKCEILILLASENTNVSGHVSNEVSIAFDNRKTIIPFKIQDVKFSDEYLYFLGRKHWIEAHGDIDAGLEKLLETVSHILAYNRQSESTDTPSPIEIEDVPISGENDKKYQGDKGYEGNSDNKGSKVYSRDEIADILTERASKYVYSLIRRLDGDNYPIFEEEALTLFRETVYVYNHNKKVDGIGNIIDFIIEQLSDEKSIWLQVQGLPGSAKNMLLQLVLYKMMNRFRNRESNYLPYYISISYFEKLSYDMGDIRTQMKEAISREFTEYFEYLEQNPDVHPVLFIEAIREHVVSKVAPEEILEDVLRPLGKFNRISSIDMGLIKNRSRLKKVISIAGDTKGYRFVTHSVPMDEKENALKVIQSVLHMYSYDLSPDEVYAAMKNLKYLRTDICLIRLIAKQLLSANDVSETYLADMYMKLALTEFKGNEDKLKEVSEILFRYVFGDVYNLSSTVYDGAVWSLPNKHVTYLEFLISYYVICQIENHSSIQDFSFFKIMLTSTENRFIESFLKENYSLQETMLEFINDNYELFDIQQKSNASYWLGRITYKKLVRPAIAFLTNEFTRLKPLVASNNKNTQENLDNHFLFRAVCNGMQLQAQANMMDEYLCIVITNDIANAVNRGFSIEYFGDNYQMAVHDTYYLDTDLSIGEDALKILNGRIERALSAKHSVLVENDLITMLTLLQARIQSQSLDLKFDIIPYVHKAIEYLQIYQKKPHNIVSEEILFYLQGMKDDLDQFLEQDKFDVGPMVYNKYRSMRELKRLQWLRHDIEDPESIAEHTFSAWLLALLFLPEETGIEGYDKKEVLDMLLVHDMAEAEIGDQWLGLNEPKKELKIQDGVMRKLFLKGTYPDIANLSYYYNIWDRYYNGVNINAKTARDVNLLQTVYTFYEYYRQYPEKFTYEDAQNWLSEKDNLLTETGYELFDRLIVKNMDFKEIMQSLQSDYDIED